jgi:hypothetical protein
LASEGSATAEGQELEAEEEWVAPEQGVSVAQEAVALEAEAEREVWVAQEAVALEAEAERGVSGAQEERGLAEILELPGSGLRHRPFFGAEEAVRAVA